MIMYNMWQINESESESESESRPFWDIIFHTKVMLALVAEFLYLILSGIYISAFKQCRKTNFIFMTLIGINDIQVSKLKSIA